MHARIIKSISTNTYELAIIEDSSGRYHIRGLDLQTKEDLTDIISTYDYHNACYVFEHLKVQLEGH